MPFTTSQQKAISHSGKNLQLIACAGSGKTEVVARRVVHLLSRETEPVFAPRNIIAFTFTEKAAAELKERIVTRCHEALRSTNSRFFIVRRITSRNGSFVIIGEVLRFARTCFDEHVRFSPRISHPRPNGGRPPLFELLKSLRSHEADLLNISVVCIRSQEHFCIRPHYSTFPSEAILRPWFS